MQTKDHLYSPQLIEILNKGADFLNSKGILSARLIMELLLCDLLELKRIDLYLNYTLPLNTQELTQLRIALKRLANNEPIQYVTGKAYFQNLELQVNPSVLIPRPETEELVLIASKYISENFSKPNILEIGTGSGCIAIYLAKIFHEAYIIALDISEKALEVAKLNAEKNNVSNIHFIKSNFLNYVPKKKYDVIISNPPYLDEKDFNILPPSVKEFEPKIALVAQDNGMKFYNKISKIALNALNANGMLFLECDEERIFQIPQLFTPNFQTEIKNDYKGIPRFAVISRH